MPAATLRRGVSRTLLGFVILSGLSIPNVVAQSSGVFVATGSLMTPRTAHTATLLRDGRVLITGGYDGQADLASAELYDPSTGTFTSAGAMTTPREHHTATLLNDGRVLIAGGSFVGGPSAELYDPSTGTFAPTGNMVTPGLYGQSAILLGDGKVLISEGVFQEPVSPEYFQVVPAPPELYDPVTSTFTPAGGAKQTVLGATATLLPNGLVLLAGGWTVGDTSLYDPTSGSSQSLGSLPLVSSTATLLTNGTVLIAGGWNSLDTVYDDPSLASAQIYDPSTGSFNPTGSLSEARDDHTATLLPGGLVLVAGGESFSRILASAELYDPAARTFSPTGGMNDSRWDHTATLLSDGRVLITGGTENEYPRTLLATAELYIPPLRTVSSASLAAPIAPGSLASLFGSGLASSTESTDSLLPLTTLGGVNLRIVDSSGTARLAPLFYVSSSQINFEVPAGTSVGDITLEIVSAPTQIPQIAAQVNNVAPGLFAYQDNTPISYALRFEPDGTETVLSARNTIVLDNRPVYLILYATGIRNRSSLTNVQCSIGGIGVSVEYAGPEGTGIPGLDQVNLRLTLALKGLGIANVTLTVDGVPSNTASVDIR